MPTPVGGTDETRRLAAFLITLLQPPDAGESWITLAEVVSEVSRKRKCSIREVSAALQGEAIPAPEIIDAVIRLHAGRRNERNSSRAQQILHKEAENLREQALHHTQPPPALHPSRRLRKAFGWTAGIAAAAVITSLVTGIIPSAIGQFFNGSKIKDSIRPGPDIIISESLYSPDGNGVPLPMVMPPNYQPPNELVKALARPMAATSSALEKQIKDAGGVNVNAVFIRIILEGNRNEPVRILNISPASLRRTTPLNTVLFDIGAQGAVSNIQMGFNLDQVSPQALNIKPLDYMTNQPYFEYHTISLATGEQDVLIIQADTNCYSASFDLSVYYTVGGTPHTEVIDDNGHPFRVSGFRVTRAGFPSYREDFELQGNYSVIPLTGRQRPELPKSMMDVFQACPYMSSNG